MHDSLYKCICRIKVQAQRKFAQGAAVLPQQTPKDTTTTQNNDIVKNQSKKMDFIMPSTPKVYTEDFLTFLCFKSSSIFFFSFSRHVWMFKLTSNLFSGSQSLPSHLRVTSFLQPQAVYTPPIDSSLTSLEYNPQISQTLSTVQGNLKYNISSIHFQFSFK